MTSYSETDIIKLFGFEARAFDDVAYAPQLPGQKMVLAGDSMAEGSHFRLDWNSPEDIARKLLTSNLSDFAAGRAQPRYAVLSVGIDPSRISLEWMGRFARRLRQLMAAHNIEIVGGDTVRASGIFFHITLIGYADKPAPMSAARPGQRLYLSRMIGLSGIGFSLCAALDGLNSPSSKEVRPGKLPAMEQGPWPTGLWGLGPPHGPAAEQVLGQVRVLLDRRRQGPAPGSPPIRQTPPQTGPGWFGICRALGAFLAPYPPGPLPAQAISATDLSDGLGVDLERWARAAGCGFKVQLDHLVNHRLWQSLAPQIAAQTIIGSGEEYALVFTTDPITQDPLAQDPLARDPLAPRHGWSGGGPIPIGEVTADQEVRFELAGQPLSLSTQSYHHFD